jgi:hypothetical protein
LDIGHHGHVIHPFFLRVEALRQLPCLWDFSIQSTHWLLAVIAFLILKCVFFNAFAFVIIKFGWLQILFSFISCYCIAITFETLVLAKYYLQEAFNELFRISPFLIQVRQHHHQKTFSSQNQTFCKKF